MRLATRALPITLLLLLAATMASATLRVPQVTFDTFPLQGYMNTVDPGLNVGTMQVEASVWKVAVTGNTDFTFMLDSGMGIAAGCGVYDGAAPLGPAPTLWQVFPPGAVAGYYATLHFGGGKLIVTLFNQNSVIQGQTTYTGVNSGMIGFYIAGPGGLWYSQDGRNNPVGPQVLTYNSIGTPGDFWICFEAGMYHSISQFNGIVLNVQSMTPVPVGGTTWGRIKALYK